MNIKPSNSNNDLVNKMFNHNLIIKKVDRQFNNFYAVNYDIPFILTNNTFTLIIYSNEIAYLELINNKLFIKFKKSVMEHNLWCMPDYLQCFLNL